MVWVHPDGSISISCFMKNAMKPDEDELTFINRESNRIKNNNPKLANSKMFIKEKSWNNTLVTTSVYKNKNKISAKHTGLLFYDEWFLTDQEKLINETNALKNKLKTSLSLTDKELKILLRET